MSSSSNWEDILGSGAVLRRIVHKGQSDSEPPDYKQYAYVHMVGKLSSNGKIFQNTREEGEGKPIEVLIGDQVLEQTVPGVMLAIRSMRIGEVCDVKMRHRFGYANEGFEPLVGPDEDLEYRIELMHIGEYEKEAVEMSPEELVIAVRKRKDRGNEFFKRGLIVKSMRCYQDAIKKSESHLPPAAEEEKEGDDGTTNNLAEVDPYNTNPDLIELRCQCAGNLGACFEKQEKFKEAKDACIAVLSVDPDNLKALLRAARVSTKMGDFKEANACLKRASEVYPKNAAVKKEISSFKEAVKSYKERTKSSYDGFLVTSPKHEVAKPEKDKPIETKEKEIPAATDIKKRENLKLKKQSMATNLFVLLLPTILFLLAAISFPALVSGSEISFDNRISPWNNLKKDKAQKYLNKVKYKILVCEGIEQRASCCVCRQAMQQLKLRQQQVEENYPKRVETIGFRMDGLKPKIPFSRSESVLISMLDSICKKLPIGIPKQEENVEKVKFAINNACHELVETFYDDMLTLLRENEYGTDDEMGTAICSDLIGVCEKRGDWKDLLNDLGPPFNENNMYCDFCKGISKLIIDNKSEIITDEENIRSPSKLCSKFALSIPKTEKPIDLISKSIGSGCINFIYTNRKTIIQSVFEQEDTCTLETIEQKLCNKLC